MDRRHATSPSNRRPTAREFALSRHRRRQVGCRNQGPLDDDGKGRKGSEERRRKQFGHHRPPLSLSGRTEKEGANCGVTEFRCPNLANP